MHDELPPDRAAVLERLRAVIGCRTQAELAAALGISQTAVSVAKRRGSIPAQGLLRLVALPGD